MKIEKINMTTNYNYQTMTIKRLIQYKYIDYTAYTKHIETMKQYNYILNDCKQNNNIYYAEYMRIESI